MERRLERLEDKLLELDVELATNSSLAEAGDTGANAESENREARLLATKSAVQEAILKAKADYEAKQKELEFVHIQVVDLKVKSVERDVLKDRLQAIRQEIDDAQAALQFSPRVVLFDKAN